MELSSILDIVANETNTTQEALKSRMKNRSLTDARALFFFFSFIKTSKSCKEIGSYLNRRHNTALYGAKRTKELKKFHKDFNLKFTNIKEKLNLNT